MAISFIGATSAETNAVTPPAHIAGDLLIAFAYRDGANTVPTLASGWTAINSAGANTNAYRVAYKVAASSSETCTGWTGANSVNCHVYRGAYLPGASIHSSASSTTLTYPALTLQNTSGSSWVVGFAGHRSIDTTTINNPPTGMTNRRVQLGTTCDVASHDTNGGVSSWISRTVATGGTSSGHYEAVVEIVNAEAATLSTPTVTVVSGTEGTPKVTTNWRNGTIYCVVVPDGDTPSVAQIKAGQRSNGTSAISSKTLTVTASGQQTLPNVTGMTVYTNYDVWFVHTNTFGDSSAVKADFRPVNLITADTGWKSAGNFFSVEGWTGTEYLGEEDGWFANTTSNTGAAIYPCNFGLNLPPSATILGVEVRAKLYQQAVGGGSPKQWTVILFDDVEMGSASSSPQTITDVTTSAVMRTYGSASGWPSSWGTWSGTVPTAVTMNQPNFGFYFAFQAFGEAGYTGYADVVQIRVTYQYEEGAPASETNAALFWAFP